MSAHNNIVVNLLAGDARGTFDPLYIPAERSNT